VKAISDKGSYVPALKAFILSIRTHFNNKGSNQQLVKTNVGFAKLKGKEKLGIVYNCCEELNMKCSVLFAVIIYYYDLNIFVIILLTKIM